MPLFLHGTNVLQSKVCFSAIVTSASPAATSPVVRTIVAVHRPGNEHRSRSRPHDDGSGDRRGDRHQQTS